MFSDPLVLTRGWTTITADAAVNASLPASERAADHSSYTFVDSYGKTHTIFIGHQNGRRKRFTARYTVNGFMSDPMVSGNQLEFSQSVYVVTDCPLAGPILLNSDGTPVLRRQMQGIGGLLVSLTAADPLFMRAVNGET